MKRVGLFLASISMIFLLTACGGKEKKLDCNISTEESGVGIKQNFLLNFEGNGKFKSAVLTQDYILSEDLLKVQDIETYKKAFESQFSKTYKDYNVSTEDNKITFKMDFKDMKALGEASGQKNVKASKKDFEDSKKNFEAIGYTCTVK